MNKLRTACTLLLTVTVLGASAQGVGPAKRSVALELATRAGIAEQWADYSADCRKVVSGGPFDPAAIVKLNAQAFGGVTPESSLWPRVQKIYREYQLAVCDAVTPSAVREHLADNFEQSLSVAEMERALQFYASPEGARFAKVANQATEKIRQQLKTQVSSYDSPTYRSTMKALQDVVREFQQDRK